jgi:hypothetical protein
MLQFIEMMGYQKPSGTNSRTQEYNGLLLIPPDFAKGMAQSGMKPRTAPGTLVWIKEFRGINVANFEL